MNCTISDNETMQKMFSNTKNIAIVGLSPNPQKDSYMVGKYLLHVGFNVIPIYPKEDEILGQKVYRDLNEIEEKIDMVVMFRKASFAKSLFEKVKSKNIPYMWLQLGIENDEVALEAKDVLKGFIQNRCIMIEHKKIKENR